MLCGLERHRDARQRGKLARPLAGAVDDELAGRLAGLAFDLPANAGDVAIVRVYAGHLRALDDPRAAGTGALGQRLREVGRIRLPVSRNPYRAGEIVGAQDRRPRRDVVAGEPLELDAEAACASHLAAHQLQPLGRLGDVHASALLPAGRESRLAFEFRIELDAVTAHPRRI